MQKFKVVIGDWSHDGHNMYDEFVFESNKSVKELQQGYRKSCKLTGVQFNHNTDYTMRPEAQDWKTAKATRLWTDYQDSEVPQEIREALMAHGLDVREDDFDPEYAAELILSFIKLSVPSLKYREASFKNSELQKIKALNGWWGDLNHQFGYGLYSC